MGISQSIIGYNSCYQYYSVNISNNVPPLCMNISIILLPYNIIQFTQCVCTKRDKQKGDTTGIFAPAPAPTPTHPLPLGALTPFSYHFFLPTSPTCLKDGFKVLYNKCIIFIHIYSGTVDYTN